MTITSLPVQRDLMIYQGTDLHQQFRWLPDGITPQDFTGWSARMMVGTRGQTATLVLSTATSGLTLSTDGIIDIHLAADQAETLVPGPNLVYVLDITDPGGIITRFLRGRIGIVVDLEPPP